MTYHLAGFRLYSVGERSARFTDLDLDLTAPEGGSRAPADTVVWLRNGGGKSSLLSLFYALVLPNANDFLGRVAKRSLTDYVDTGDTAHTIAIWYPAAADTLDGAPEHVLVTGAVYEWADLRRPVEADRARDKLHSSYYAFYALPGVLDADLMPLSDEAGSPLRLNAFVTAVREAAASRPQAADLVVTSKQHEWTTALTNRGLDPELFRTQKQMNHVEGGVEDMFKFASAREFINLLIDLTATPEDAENVAKRLSAISSLLEMKPAKTAEREFCLESLAALARLEAVHTEVTEARQAHDVAFGDAAGLAAAFTASEAEARAQIDSTGEGIDETERSRSVADQQQGIAYDLLYLYQLRAARFRVENAERVESGAGETVDDAAELVLAWEVAGHLAAKRRLEAGLEANAREAGLERARTAPQRREHDEHAARLRVRLLAVAVEHEEAAEQAGVDKGEAERAVREHRTEAERFRGLVRKADQAAAEAQAKLKDLEADIEVAVRAGALPSATTDPREHDNALGQKRQGLEATLKAVRGRRAARPAARRKLTDRHSELITEINKLDGERGRIAAEQASLKDRARELSSDQRVLDLTEAGEDSPVDLWGEADTLTRRLTDEIVGADVALVRHEAERMEDRRAAETHSRTGLLPTTLDAERVRSILLDRGIVSETGWTHLLSVLPDSRVQELLDDPDLVRVGMGVVVATGDAEDAALILMDADASTTALVGLYTAADVAVLARADVTEEPRPTVAPVWTGMHRGLVDSAVADAAIRRINLRITDHDRDRLALLEARDRDRRLLENLARFLADSPTGHLAGLERRLDDLDETLAELGKTAEAVHQTLEEIEEAEGLDAQQETDTSAEIADIGQFRVLLAALIRKVDAKEGWRLAWEQATAESGLAAESVVHHEAERERSSTEVTVYATAVNRENTAAGERRNEVGRLRFLDVAPEIDDDEAAQLETLRLNYDQADRAWEAQAAQSVLAERERMLNARLAEENAALRETHDHVRKRAAALLETRYGQTSSDRTAALAEARRMESEARTALGRAEGETKNRRNQLAAISQRRAEPPRRTLPVEPVDAEHADALAIEQEGIGQAAIERRGVAERKTEELKGQRVRLEGRAGAFALLVDGLPEAAAITAAPFPGNESEARERKLVIAGRLEAAQERARTAAGARTSAVGELRAIGNRFPSVTTPAKDRLVHDPEEVVADQAGALVRQLKLRAEMIEGELADIAKDQAIVVNSLTHLVSGTLDTLRKAERYSRVTTQLGGWSGKQVLRIGFTAPASEADLRAYVDRVIERRIEAGVKAEGLPLLKDAVHEVAGPSGFRVKVLKPTLDVVSTTEDITRLGKWSGGEKLTVCVALYCTIAALRAANSGRRDRSGGVLLLDNPIGRASHGSLVRLQRAVATAHHVQLVYTTGVKDPDAVSRFPTIIRLENRPGRTQHRRYIVEEENGQAGTRTVGGVRVAHAESPEAVE
ncbi:hypothetical protein GCM10027445_52890 [Amycolatopsis endophytica]|uniref:Chromosome segregation ATPase n=1 Tax=Amycolatopsis endophytica TaxID=860233 RepID=A0A853B9U9_9PSEU|nr:hypothetical protein [Amycolatopsis endophytica]NYI91770.1 hypothetical protein [Amycolatopsis endophytica]